ncbi:uncharacterized protein LOC143344538 [Colletes latitarsis]|uniref:uncharacterized protein LOC143344538 n=1 Tax=Colletes latitarsis TaxID=2605962 RepID=UPI004036C43B
MHAGCTVQLRREVRLKKAVINVCSTDNTCFAWSVVAALYPAESHVSLVSSYPHYTTVLNIQDIEFPMTLNQIKKFEHINNISINVYTIENKKVLPIRVTDKKMERHVNLLYLEGANDVGHFTWIKNLSRLVCTQLSKHNGRKYFCDRCLHYFSSNEKLEAHTMDCEKMNDCAIILPNDDGSRWLSFSNYNRKERVPFIVYADLECILEKTDTDREASRYMYQHHQVFSVGYYVRCSYDDSLSTFQCRRDPDCVSWFVRQLQDLSNRVKSILSINVPMENLSAEQLRNFNTATHCHICETPFTRDDIYIWDHLLCVVVKEMLQDDSDLLYND